MSAEQNPKKKKNKKRTICAIILVIMMACFWFIVFLLLFQVRKINITGNEFLSKSSVAEWIEEDELSTNSLYVWWKFNFSHYKKPAAVEDVKVSLSNPWTVKVKVKEKQIVGYLIVDDQFVYFDKDGLVLEKTNEWRDNIPGIEGLNVSKAELYKELPVSKGYKKVFSNLLEMSSSLKKYKLKPDRVICKDEDIYLYFGKKCVLLGNKNFPDKIAQIPPIFDKLGDKTGTLHLERFDEFNTTITFAEGELPEEKSEESVEDSAEEVADEETQEAQEPVPEENSTEQE